MSETATQIRSNLPEPQAAILFIHGVQLGLSVIVTCLDIYGVHYIPYNILVCSLIIASRFSYTTKT
jgi:hypothetical protein